MKLNVWEICLNLYRKFRDSYSDQVAKKIFNCLHYEDPKTETLRKHHLCSLIPYFLRFDTEHN